MCRLRAASTSAGPADGASPGPLVMAVAAQRDEEVLVAFEPDRVIAVDERADDVARIASRLLQRGGQALAVASEARDGLSRAGDHRGRLGVERVQLGEEIETALLVARGLPDRAHLLDGVVDLQ